MSYDIYLEEPETGETIEFDEPHNMIGGTYIIGGTKEAWLNITWNYSEFYYKTIDEKKGIRFLYGRTGKEAIPILEKAISELMVDMKDLESAYLEMNDYWAATKENAAIALQSLLAFAKLRPDGIFRGD